MRKELLLKMVPLLIFILIGIAGSAQSKNEFVPCQEVPQLIQNYAADYRALS